MNRLATTFKQYKWTLLLVVGILFIPTYAVFAQGAIAGFLYTYIVIGFFGWLLGMAGVVLNYSVNFFVIGFGSQLAAGGPAGIGAIVDSTWSTIRDLFNLTFIFGLVYIGFKMILRTDDGQTRRWLINLILAALLVNFSLFITKFVVDFSNILAVEIINLGMEGPNPVFLPATDDTTGTGAIVANSVDLSGSMVQAMNMGTVIGEDGSIQAASETDGNASFSFVFGTLMVFLVAMFVFISAGILLLVRGAVLIVLMIISPFLFLGMVLPTLSSFSRDLWKRLFTRAFLAPIYIALLYITMQVSNSVIQNAGNNNFSEAVAGSAGDGVSSATQIGATFGPFILIVVLLMMSLVAAQKLGAEGAGTVMKVGRNLRQRGQRAVGATTFGMAARTGRSVIGGGAAAASRSRSMRTMASQKGWKGVVGRAGMNSAMKVADSSFDARNVGGMGKATGLGAGKKGGFVTRQKEDMKKKEDMLKAIGTVDTETPEGKAEVEAFEKENTNKADQYEMMSNDAVTMGTVASEIKTLEESIEKRNNQLSMGRYEGTDENEMGEIMTPKDVATEQAKLEEDKQKLEITKAVQEERKAIENLTSSIDDLSKKEAKASSPEERADLRTQREANEQELEIRKSNLAGGSSVYRERANNADAEVKYQNQMEYMGALEETAKFKQNIAEVLSGKALIEGIRTGFKQNPRTGPAAAATLPTGAAVGGAVVGGAVGGVGATFGAGAVAAGSAYSNRQVIKDLQKKVGGSAKEMASKDSENKARKKQVEAYREMEKDVDGYSPNPEPSPEPSTDNESTT